MVCTYIFDMKAYCRFRSRLKLCMLFIVLYLFLICGASEYFWIHVLSLKIYSDPPFSSRGPVLLMESNSNYIMTL